MDCVRWRIHASTLEAVSVRISKPAATHFHWLFQIQQELCALTNPCVSFGNSFGDDFCASSNTVSCLFLSQHGLCALTNPCFSSWNSFPWLFSSQQGLCTMTNQCVPVEAGTHWFVSRPRISFPLQFPSQQGLYALMNPYVTCGSSFDDYFWGASNSVFLDYFWVNRVVCDDESIRHLWKQFSWWFLSRQQLNLPWLILSQQGLWALMNPCISSGTSFGDDFWVCSNSVFLDYFWVNRDYVRWPIHT